MLKKPFLIRFIVILLCSQPTVLVAQHLEQAVKDLASQISETLASENKKKIAILPLTDLAGSRTRLGQLLAEELTNELFLRREDRFDVVERTKVEAIWQEQELGAGGWLTSEAASNIGSLVGADSLLTGSIGELGDRLRINARLIAVPSGQLFATASTFVLKTGLDGLLAPMEGGSGNENSSPGAGVQSKDVKNVTFDLIGCEKQIRLIVCKLIATNNDVDREFEIDTYNKHTGLYDQTGRVFYSELSKVANKEGARPRTRLITEVPTAIEIHFQGVPSTIEFIKILSINTNLGQVEFRDVRF